MLKEKDKEPLVESLVSNKKMIVYASQVFKMTNHALILQIILTD
jgi:hypothetical protein